MSQPALQYYSDSWQATRSDSRVKLWSATIEGQLQSKANSRKLMEVPVKGARRIYINGQKRWTKSRPLFVKSDAAKSYEDSFRSQIVRPARPIACDLVLVVRVWYQSRRSDLDVSLLMDCLQRSGVIENDRSIREQHLYGYVDPDQPRVEVELYAL